MIKLGDGSFIASPSEWETLRGYATTAVTFNSTIFDSRVFVSPYLVPTPTLTELLSRRLFSMFKKGSSE